MGYTHYWRSNTEIPPETWQAISDDVRKLAKGFKGAEVEIDDHEIVIHGGADTFALQRTAEEFGFCKTRLGAYDQLVCATLAVATERYPGLDVSSDGFMQDDGGAWENAMNWASSTLGRKVPNPSGGAEADGPEYDSRWTAEQAAAGLALRGLQSETRDEMEERHLDERTFGYTTEEFERERAERHTAELAALEIRERPAVTPEQPATPDGPECSRWTGEPSGAEQSPALSRGGGQKR